MATKKKAAPQRAYSIQDLINEGIAYTPESTEATAAAEPQKRTWGQAIGDTAVQLAEGVNTTLGAVPSIVAPDGAMAGFFRDNAEYWRDKQSDVLKQRIAATDQRIQEAGKEGVMSQIGTAVSEYWNDPAQAARLVATNLPSMAATLGTGALAGAAAKGVAAARGVGAAGEAALAAQYGTRTAMATNAALNAGGARGEAYEDMKRAALAQGMSPEQAEQVALDGSIMPGVVGGVAGAVSGKLGLEKALLGQPGAGAGTALRRSAGAFGAELTGEQIEEVAPKITTNYEAGKIDPARSLTDDLGRTMVETTIGAGPGALVAGGVEGMNTPAQAAADAIRATEKVPESGALTKAVNAGVEAKAQAVEAGAPVPTRPGADQSAEAAPEPVDDPVRDQILALPDGARQDALRAYAVVNRTDVAKGVQQYNRKLLDRLLAENAPPPVLGERLTETDMGSMLGGGGMAGRADPLAGALGMNNEAQAAAITNVANVAERRPPMPASDAARMLDEARNRGLDLAVAEHPAGGFVLVPPQWVTPDMAAQGEARLNETIARMQQADAAPVERAPRTRTDGVGLDLQTDPVQNYVGNLRQVNTPAAQAFVRDFDAGRITPADVQQRMQAEQGLTPEQRIARAAAEAPAQTDPVADRLRQAVSQAATVAPTDILNPAGEPFKTRMAADRAAKKTPGAVVPVEGGFVVRPQEPVNVQDVPQAPEVPQAAPAVSQPGQAAQAVGAQPAGPAAGVPAEGSGAVEATGVSGEFADLFDEQGRPKFSNAQSVKDFKKRTGLGQDGVRAIQAAIQEGRPITVDEARQADLAGQERRKAALEQSKADSEAEAQAAKQNSAKPTEPSKVLGDYEIPGIEGVTNRVRVLQRGGRIEAIGLEEGTVNNDLSRLIQSGQTVEQALAALYGDHGPNEAPNPSRVKRAGQTTSAAAPAAAGLTDGAPTANTGAQAAPATGAATASRVAKEAQPFENRFVVKDDITGARVEWQALNPAGGWKVQTTFDNIEAATAAVASRGIDPAGVSVWDSAWNANAKRFTPAKKREADRQDAEMQASAAATQPEAPKLTAEQRKVLDDSLRAGAMSVEDYMKATGLTDEDVGTFQPDGLRAQAEQKARAANPYYQLTNKIQDALSDQMKSAMDAASSTPQQRKSKEERIARITRDRSTLDMLTRKFEHPFNNNYVSKLSPILKTRFNKQFEGVKTGEFAKAEFNNASYQAWAELLIEAAGKKAMADGFVEQGATKPTAAAKPAATATTSAPIEDAGEKIGGARKDRWKERGLDLDDLDAMTEAEGAELATKANVWKPDYEALSEASEPVTAAMVKTIYDQLAAKPKKNTPEGRRQYVQMMRIVRDVLTEAKGPDAVRNAYLEIRNRAGLNTKDPQAKAAARELLFSVYKGRSDPFVLDGGDLMKVKKMVDDGFPAKAAPWKTRLTVGRREGGGGTTERGIEIYMERSAEVGTPLTREQILDGFYRVSTKDNKTVAFAATKEDAEAAAATVYERDMKGKKDGKPEPVRPNLDELKRENLPQRIDRDVTSEDFVRDLGFRGVEFGNWSAQDERQRILNMAYDGLMDLAEIMGVPPKAMSLNGTLGMAFGARGGGRFAAHYEPGKLVINMTKIRGGGSMAHEWAHAMDHYFGELDKQDAYTTAARGASGWYSEDQYLGVPRKRMERVGNEWKSVEKMRLDNLRPEMAAAFDEVMRALFSKQITKAEMVRSHELDLERTEALARNETQADLKAMYQNMAQNKRQALNELRGDPEGTMYAGRGRSDYASQAQALSGKSENGYWTRPTEMFARAFESWVFDKVTAMGARSDYLVHGVEEDRFAGGGYKGNPYPTGEERARINAAFDKLTKTIKTKETDTGNVAMFSRRSASGNRVPDVVIGHRLGDLNRHPDYEAAKAGDSLAAARIATDLVDDAFVQRVRDAAGGAEVIVPVVSVEATGRNKIPAAVADLLAEKLGGDAEADIVQANSPKRTAMDGLDRLLSPPVFEGPVRNGAAYVLVDDTVTQGGTFASLASHIRDNGGRVAGLVALTGKQYSAKLSPSPELLSQVRDRFNDIEPQFRAATGYGFDALTESEARYLVKHDDAQRVRDRIIAAGNQAGNERDAGVSPRASRSQAAPSGLSQRAANQIVDAIRSRWANAPEVVVVESLQDPHVPEAVRREDAKQRSQGATGGPEGFWYGGKAYIVSSALDRPADVVRVLFHEVLGHYGLRGAFGDALTPILKQIAALRRADVQVKAKAYGLDMSKESDRLQAAEEVLAEMAQTTPELGYVKRAIAAIRNWLRANVPGFKNLALTDADIIQAYILPARGFVTRSKETGAQSLERAMASFSRTAGDQTQTEAFKRWFKDSKVVDADGKPLVVYHGTHSSFTEFKPNDALGGGMFFSPSPEEAGAFTGATGSNIMPVYLSAQKVWPKIVRSYDEVKAIRAAKSKGYDAIRVRDDQNGVVNWVVFDPTQVKSAIGNNGNFDPANADIRFSRTTDAAKAVGDTLKSITVSNVKQRAGFKLTDYLGIGLQALGRRQIVDIYGDMLPLAEYNRLVQQMEADKNEGGAEADQLVTRWAKLDDEGKLADLMHDATLAQIDPAEDFVDGDDKGKYLELQRKYNLLSDEAKKVYADTRDSYKAHHAKVRSAIKERIERSEIKGERKAALLKQMDDEFFKAIKGVYFPLARFGQYAVTVKGPDGKVESVSRAETKAEAEALRNNLLSAFPRDKGFTVGRVMLSKDFIADRDAVGRGFMTELYQVLDKQDMDAAQRAELEDTLGQLYLSSLPDLSWAKHGIHRKGTPGFSQDARRAFAQNMFHGARYLAKLRYSDLMQDELAAMQRHVDDWREVEDFDQNSAQRVVDEMNKRHESLMNPKSNPLSTALTSLGFVFHLGLSPASAMVNLSQTALVAYPIMGAKWGFGKASAALLKASAEAAKGKNDITASLNADELAAYNEAVRAGTIDVTMAHDLAGIAQGEDAGVMWKIRPVMRYASFLFHHAERFNRQVTFVAAYRLAREAGADHKAAFEQATKATYDGHFDYSACVDDATEILTTTGWKKRADLQVGDVAIATDASGRAVHSKVLAVNVYEGDREVIEFKSSNRFSMVLTPNHEAVIQSYSSRDKKWQGVRKVRADSLKNHHFILRTPLAPLDEQGGIYGEDFASLLGWIAAEGWYSKYRKTTAATDVRIGQSVTHNPEYVAEIRGILERLGGEFKEYTYERSRDVLTTFVLRRSLGRRIQECLPEKVLTPDLVASMSTSEMRAFLMAFLKGDGTQYETGRAWAVGQKNGANLDLLQAMATMCGMRATLSPINSDGMAHLYVVPDDTGARSHVRPLEQIRRVEPLVWCPTTEHGTWIARRNGAVFVTGNSNRPRIMQGNVAKVLLLFKQYGQNMVYTLARNAQQAIKGESPEVRKQARKALGGLLATHAAAAGVLGLPMVTTLLAAASMIGGDDDEPWDAKVALQNMLADTLGQKPAEVLAHGLSRLTPWDISGRVGLDKLIFPDVQEGLEGQRLWESAATQALGPVGGIFGGALKGLDLMSDGHYKLGLEAMLPAVLRQGVKSIRYATDGAQDKTGVVIKDEVSMPAVVGQLLGFSPSEVRLAQEGKSAIYQQDKALGERRQELLTKAARATMAKDAEARAEAMKEIQRFNQKNPTRRITPLNVLQSVRNRQKRIDQAEGGVYLPKNRRDAIQAGRFALAESE